MIARPAAAALVLDGGQIDGANVAKAIATSIEDRQRRAIAAVTRRGAGVRAEARSGARWPRDEHLANPTVLALKNRKARFFPASQKMEALP
jgi:hypothetical protein